MRRSVGLLCWIETALSACAGCLGLLTLVWRDWIEAVFGVDPDHHNGSLEWIVVAICLIVAVSFGVLARRQWRSGRLAQG